MKDKEKTSTVTFFLSFFALLQESEGGKAARALQHSPEEIHPAGIIPTLNKEAKPPSYPCSLEIDCFQWWSLLFLFLKFLNILKEQIGVFDESLKEGHRGSVLGQGI